MKDKIEQYYIDNISDENIQIELIKAIQRNEIKFKKKSGIKHLPTVLFHKKSWTSDNKLIKLWFENPGFMSFTYLKFGKEELDKSKIKYYTEICLAIQDKDRKLDLDKRYLGFTRPTYEEFINPKPKNKNY